VNDLIISTNTTCQKKIIRIARRYDVTPLFHLGVTPLSPRPPGPMRPARPFKTNCEYEPEIKI